MLCGRIFRRGVIIRANRCLFCLGDESPSAIERCTQYTYPNNFSRHMSRHYASFCGSATGIMKEPSQCPHPLCSTGLSSLASFRRHCHEEHGLLAPDLHLGGYSVALPAGVTSPYDSGDDGNDACGQSNPGDPANSISADEGYAFRPRWQ